jgi:hypothetical protein
MPTQHIPGFCALCRSHGGCLSVVEDGRLIAVAPDPHQPGPRRGVQACAPLGLPGYDVDGPGGADHIP